MMWDGYGSTAWGWAIGALLLMLVVAAVVVVAVRTGMTPQSSAARLSPKDILDERLARGELTPGQYRQHLKALGLTS